MLHRISALFAASLLMIGCTPNVQVQGTNMPVDQYIESQQPEPGSVATVTVGQAIYSQEKVLRETGTRLDAPINESFGLGARVVLPDGAILLTSSIEGERAYCSRRAAYIQPLGAGPIRSVCFYDRNQDGSFESFWVVGTLASTARDMQGIPYSKRTAIIGRDGFVRELIHQGIQEQVIRIKYREFKETLARPAFSQDLTYTFRELPYMLEFQNVRIEIKDIDDNRLRYVVKSGF